MRLIVCILIFYLLIFLCYPQDQKEGIEFSRFTTLKDERGRQVAIFSSGVVVRKGDIIINADVVAGWGGKENRVLTSPEEIYAVGNVKLNKGGQIILADEILYNFKTLTGIALNAELRVSDEKRGISVVVKAKEIEEREKGLFILKDLLISTCPFAEPHYEIFASDAEIKFTKEKPTQLSYIALKNVYFKIANTPLLYFPGFTYSPSPFGRIPLSKLRLGYNERFGHYVLTDWEFEVSKGFVDSINPFEENDPADDFTKWGNLILEADYRTKRGPAFGVDLEYDIPFYSGKLDTYYLRDRGPDPDIDYNRKFLEIDPVEDKDRYRIRYFHNHQILETLSLQVELSYLSDRHLLEEFFEKEFKEWKEQETLAYLRWGYANMAAYYLERHRLNDFQTQVEFLPRARFMLYEGEISRNFRVNFSAELSNLRFMYDEIEDLDSYRSLRGDFFVEVSYPVDLDVISFYPFVRARSTVYSANVMDEGRNRFIYTGGVKLNSKFHKVYLTPLYFLNIEKFRHVIDINAGYLNNFESTVPRDEILKFDSIDYLGKYEEIFLEINNIVNAKFFEGKKSFELIKIGVGCEYYPDSQRDTLQRVIDSYTYPAYFAQVYPEDSIFKRRHFSNIYTNLTLNVPGFTTLRYSGEFDPTNGNEAARELSLSVMPAKNLRIGAGQVFFDGYTNAASLEASTVVADVWHFDFRIQYDYMAEEYISQKLVIKRDYHDFWLQILLEYDAGKDERKYLFYFLPKFAGRVMEKVKALKP